LFEQLETLLKTLLRVVAEKAEEAAGRRKKGEEERIVKSTTDVRTRIGAPERKVEYTQSEWLSTTRTLLIILEHQTTSIVS
jgi:hypothetical protein